MRASLRSGEAGEAAAAARQALSAGIDPLEALERGFAEPLRALGEEFARQEVDLARLMTAAEAVKAAQAALEAAGPAPGRAHQCAGVIGTVEGDVHDIGKTVVASVLRAHGYEVHDLGAEVPADRFIAAASRHGAQVIAMSALLSTAMVCQRDVVQLLAGLAPGRRCFTIVGGAAVSQQWADEIGAGGYAPGPREAAQLLERRLRRGFR